jgi:hypothetical protein
LRAVDDAAPEWPVMFIELQCDSCGQLVFAERIQLVTLAAYPSIAWHWRDQMLAHVESCPRAWPAGLKTGETGRPSSPPGPAPSTEPEPESRRERPPSNNSGRSE